MIRVTCRVEVIIMIVACLSAWSIPAAAVVTEIVSVDSAGNLGNGASISGNCSDDGRIIVFASDSSILVADDTNNVNDVFVFDRTTGVTERVSLSSSGAQANGASSGWSPVDSEVYEPPMVSTDGRYVVFSSVASNLVSGDTNGFRDVFVHDRLTHTTTRVSVSSGATQGNGNSYYPSISADGRYVAFVSDATVLVSGDTNGRQDAFRHDRTTGNTIRVSIAWNGAQALSTGSEIDMTASISGDGDHVAFQSHAYNLVPNDTNGEADMFVRDISAGNTERVSVSSTGTQGNGFCWGHVNYISYNGSVVVFSSYSDNLVLGDTNGANDVFLRDRAAGLTRRISVSAVGAQGNAQSNDPSCSSDGNFVAFTSTATNLVDPPADGSTDSYLVDIVANRVERVGVDSCGDSLRGWDGLGFPSSGGRYLSFSNLPTAPVFTTANAMLMDRSALIVAHAKSKPDANSITVSAGTVTARFDGAFYLQQDGIAAPAHASGLRISWPGLVQVGKRYMVTGQMRTNADGERYLEAASVSPHTSGWTVSSINVGMNNRAIGGGGWKYSEGDTSGQMGVEGASGLNNIGLCATAWGRITSIAPDKTYFYMDDGSGLQDGTSTSGSANVGVRVLLNPIDLTPGDYVGVSGVSSCFRNSSAQVQRLIRGVQFAPYFPAAPAFVFAGIPNSNYPNQVQIVFSPVLGATGYRLYRSTDGVTYGVVSDSYTPMPGGGGMFYRTEYANVYFRVKAVGLGGQEGAASQTIHAKVLDARQQITVTQPPLNGTGVPCSPSVAWQAVAGARWIGVEIHSPTVWGAMMLWPGTTMNYGQVDNCLTYVVANAPLKPLTQYRLYVYAIDSDHWKFASCGEWFFTTGP